MRVFLRLLSPLFGLAVAVADALLAVEVIADWLIGSRRGYSGLLVPSPRWPAELAILPWHSLLAVVVCACVAVVGRLLLWVAGLAHRREIRLTDPTKEISVTASPDVLARLVGQKVRAGEEIVSASARRVRVNAVGRGEHPGQLRPTVRGQVVELIDDLPLARRPRISVAVHAARGLR